MNYDYIILNLFMLHYIILHLTFVLLLICNLFKVAVVRLNWRGLDCGNTIQGLFYADLSFL